MKFVAANLTGSYFSNGTNEAGSYCCKGSHRTLKAAIKCFESQGEHAFGGGLHGGGYEYRAISKNEIRIIEQDSDEFRSACEEIANA